MALQAKSIFFLSKPLLLIDSWRTPSCLLVAHPYFDEEVLKMGRYSTIASLEKMTPEEVKARNFETYGSKVKFFRNRAGLSADQLADIISYFKI